LSPEDVFHVKTILMKFSFPFIILLPIAICVIIPSCGPSAQEVEKRQQHLIDSTRLATQLIFEQLQKATDDSVRLVKKLEEARLTAEADARRRVSDKNVLTRVISDYETELFVQEQKLEDLKTPKFLRTPEEKELQLRYQRATVQELRMNIEGYKEIIEAIAKGAIYRMPERYKNDSIAVN
jgi:hypothetical protein